MPVGDFGSVVGFPAVGAVFFAMIHLALRQTRGPRA
jgi:hypothetical protein